MKKKRITYGVSGMMEYQAVIKVGRNKMKVLFTDGSASAMGVNPATFTTENYMVQHAIENSNDFQRGRIRVINTIELEDELIIERNGMESASNNQDTQNNVKATILELSNTPTEQNADDAEGDAESESEENLVQMEFMCNDDAKDYLEQTFGYIRSKLRNRQDIIAVGKAHGIDIQFV